MGYQLLQGVKVTPKGNYNLGRFQKSMVGGAFPTSFAFGGWIYNATSDIGFSAQPTEIKLSIVLEVTDRDQKYAFFDIQDKDLKCDAGAGGDENLYDIDFNGVKFTDFILFAHDITIENNTKILSVTFKDYSVIFDKIYVGLLKRQGKKHVYKSDATIEFPVVCPDCLMAGSSFSSMGSTTRSMSYGSYVGINGQTYDNFKDIPDQKNLYAQWEALFKQPVQSAQFDLNGGYLIIGTEEATEERCGDLANVSYNLNQLLASLRMRGIKFEGAFPKEIQDADYIYHQNYMGPLREVLGQWCSDLGLDYYCSGKTFIGISLNRAIDISPIVSIADPTTPLGSQFALNQNSAILSYKSSVSLNNTFKQSVITANNRPRTLAVDVKSPKRYVGMLPLHPIDFNRHSNRPTLRCDAFGTWFQDIAWANDFELSSTDRNLTLPELDGRTYGEIDTAICLSHYDEALRDIFCQDRALNGETEAIRAANFRALGMFPLVEITDEAKTVAIEAMVQGGGDDVSNICRDQRFYRVYLGYYYPDFKQDILNWEQSAADSMYKFGLVTQGLLNHYPYMPQNSLVDMSPKEGLYGEAGTSLLRISHNIQPDAQQYFVMRQSPFKDLILYSGLMTPMSESLPLDLTRSGIFPTGLFYSEISNEWGTLQEEYKRAMSLNLDDVCAQQFGENQSFTNISTNIPKKQQDWRLDLFRPQANPDLQRLYAEYSTVLDNFPQQTDMDRTVQQYYNLHNKLQQQCSKLHVLLLADTKNHPNIYVEFNPKGTMFTNVQMLQAYVDRQREAVKRRAEMKTPTVCDLSLLQEMCKGVLSGRFHEGTLGDPRYGCITDEDKFNYFTEGFTLETLLSPNSRGLNIKVVKNPIRNDYRDPMSRLLGNSDTNGAFYYSDLLTDQLQLKTAQVDFNIVYPITTNLLGGYRGILSSEVTLENRTPEIVEVFGEPVNCTFNQTTSLKVVNNTIDPDIQPQLDPFRERFVPYMTVITGGSQVVTTVEQYHNYVKDLNNYELTSPMKTVDLTLAGTPANFGSFSDYLNPSNGLNRLSMSVTTEGMTTSLSFADRPKVLPKQESILNKITARLKKN
jgi:hypothetical protein